MQIEPKPNYRGWIHLPAEHERPWVLQFHGKVTHAKIWAGPTVESFPAQCGRLVLCTVVTLVPEEVTCPHCQEHLAQQVEKALLAQSARVGQSSRE